MVFDLEEPFKSLYRKSYLRANFIKGDKDFGIAALARKFKVNKATVASALYNDSY